ncbi:MAG TPA: ABC transporter permease [Acidisarcina sp.]
MNKFLKNVIFYAAIAAIWLIVVRMRVWPTYVVPAPHDVLQTMHDGFKDDSFWIAIRVSLRRLAIGYGIAVVLGGVLGLAIASSRFLDDTLGRLLVGLQSPPSACWLPLAILWFGLNESAILFVVVMGSFLSIAISVKASLQQVPQAFRMVGRNLGAQGWRQFRYVLLPASLPHLISGLKQGWAFAWHALITAEMLYISLGLGQLLMAGRDLNDMSLVAAVLLIIIAIGWTVEYVLFRNVERSLQRRWGLLPA